MTALVSFLCVSYTAYKIPKKKKLCPGPGHLCVRNGSLRSFLATPDICPDDKKASKNDTNAARVAYKLQIDPFHCLFHLRDGANHPTTLDTFFFSKKCVTQQHTTAYRF